MPKWGETFLDRYDVPAFDRQEIPVAPEAIRAFLNGLAGDALLDGLVVVDHLERPEAKLADMQSCGGILMLALFTWQRFDL